MLALTVLANSYPPSVRPVPPGGGTAVTGAPGNFYTWGEVLVILVAVAAVIAVGLFLRRLYLRHRSQRRLAV